MIHPVLVVAIGIILTRMCAATLFSAIRSRFNSRHAAFCNRFSNSIVSMRSVFHIIDRSATCDISERGCIVCASKLNTLIQSTSPVRNTAAWFCMTPLHLKPESLLSAGTAVGMPQPVESREREISRIIAADCGALALAIVEWLRRNDVRPIDRIRRDPAANWSQDDSHHGQIRRLPHQRPSARARSDSGLPPSSSVTSFPAMAIRRNPAHVVVHGWQHRDWFLRVTSTPAKIRADSAMPGNRSSITSGPRCSRCRCM